MVCNAILYKFESCYGLSLKKVLDIRTFFIYIGCMKEYKITEEHKEKLQKYLEGCRGTLARLTSGNCSHNAGTVRSTLRNIQKLLDKWCK